MSVFDRDVEDILRLDYGMSVKNAGKKNVFGCFETLPAVNRHGLC